MGSEPKFELETHREVWDTHGNVTEVGPDRDGINLVEIRQRDSHSEEKDPIHTRMSFHPAQARLVAQALIKSADEIDAQKVTK